MSKRYPNSKFLGIDINSSIIKEGNIYLKKAGVKNCQLKQGDIYSLDSEYVSKFDGIISLQTISWLPNFYEPIKAICNLRADWIALSSLFYDGPLSCNIEVQDYDENLQPTIKSFYNIYSLPILDKFLNSISYSNFKYHQFDIDIDLPKPKLKGKGTYTETLLEGRKIQISGPLLMPWHFISAQKI